MKVQWVDANEEEWPDPDGSAFPQSRPYAIAAAASGAQIGRAVVRDGNDIVATAQMLRGRCARVILRGPMFVRDLDAAGRRHVLRRLARQSAAVVALPEVPMEGFGLVPLLTSRYCALWSLDPDPDALRDAMTGKWRNRMVAAARQGVEIRPAGPVTLGLLIAAEGAQRQARGYQALPPGFTQALPADSLRIWHWHKGGQLQAAMCFVRHGGWATYHMGWAGVQARAAGAHGLMLWQAALALRAEGVRMLDLGDVNTARAPGLARFKLGTGATLHRLGATCLVVPG